MACGAVTAFAMIECLILEVKHVALLHGEE